MRGVGLLRCLVVLFAVVSLSACGGVATSGEESSDGASEQDYGASPSDEADSWDPGSTSSEGYGAIEKFNEFSISFMATMMKNLQDAAGELGLSMSKAYFGGFDDIDCSCQAGSELIECSCADGGGGICSGSAWHSNSDDEVVMGSVSCSDFHLDSDTVLSGSFEGSVWISSLVLDFLGDGYGGFFGGKEVGGGEADQCAITAELTDVCNLVSKQCYASKLVSMGMEMGDGGFTIDDVCGDFTFGAGTVFYANVCIDIFSLDSFYSTFKLDGEFNGSPAYMRNNIECDIGGLISF